MTGKRLPTTTAIADSHSVYSENGGAGIIDELRVETGAALTPIGKITGLQAHVIEGIAASSSCVARGVGTRRLTPQQLSTGQPERDRLPHYSLREADMAFVQIIEFRTKNKDEMQKIADELLAQRGPDWTARRGVICEDRDDPDHIVQVVFFDSYESAMQNSNLPVTQQLNEQMTPLMEGPPTFSNLEVIDDRTF